MAGHAPEIVTWSKRLHSWLCEASDVSLSALMLGASVLVGFAIYFITQRLAV